MTTESFLPSCAKVHGPFFRFLSTNLDVSSSVLVVIFTDWRCQQERNDSLRLPLHRENDTIIESAMTSFVAFQEGRQRFAGEASNP